jgi:hypothetical protein
MIDIRQPLIQGSDKEQLAQIRSYLYQLVPQLQFYFENMPTQSGEGGGGPTVIKENTNTITRLPTDEEAVEVFYAIKPLIIKNGDIIEAYSEEITEDFSGRYVAQLDYNEYVANTNSRFTTNELGLQIATKKTEIINNDAVTFSEIISNECFIKLGELGENDDGSLKYGISIGKETSTNEGTIFEGTVTITPERISFYDASGTEVGWFANQELHTNASTIISKQTIGQFIDEVETDGSIVTRWTGEVE